MRATLRPVGWLALLVAGFAATLSMVQAGTNVSYQHYVVPSAFTAVVAPWAIVVFALEAFAVLAGLAQHRAAIAREIAAAGRWPLVVLVAAFVLTSATLSRNPAHYLAELVLASFVQLVHLGAISLAVAGLPSTALDRLNGIADRLLGGSPCDTVAEPGGPDRFAWTLATFVVALSSLLAVWSYQRHPHVPDEVVYLLQARYLAAGRLDLPLPPVAEAFNINLMMYQADRWFSPVPPGWPFILAIGALLGVPWLVNPVLGGLNVLLAYMVVRELYPRRTARLAIVLLATSPWALFLSMSFMTHTATLAAALLAALGVARLRRDPRLRFAVMAGAGIGIVALIRPLEGVAVALLLGVWSLGARGHRLRFAPSMVMTFTAVLVGAVVLPYNAYYTGSARVFPIMAYTDAVYGPGTNALGFGPNRGLNWPGLDPLPGHGLPDIFINANMNLFQVNTELLGWPTGSLLLVFALVLAGRTRLRRADWWMVAVVGGVIGIHSFYYFSGGPDFGARYWYLVIVPCLVLAARSVEVLGSTAAEPVVPLRHPRILAGAGMLVVVAMMVFVPWRAINKYHHYRSMRPDVRSLAADPEFRDAVVLVRGNRNQDYVSAAFYNPLDIQGHEPLFVRDLGSTVTERLVQAFPERRFWILDGPTVTGGGYVVVAGPMSGTELTARHGFGGITK